MVLIQIGCSFDFWFIETSCLSTRFDELSHM